MRMPNTDIPTHLPQNQVFKVSSARNLQYCICTMIAMCFWVAQLTENKCSQKTFCIHSSQPYYLFEFKCLQLLLVVPWVLRHLTGQTATFSERFHSSLHYGQSPAYFYSYVLTIVRISPSMIVFTFWWLCEGDTDPSQPISACANALWPGGPYTQMNSSDSSRLGPLKMPPVWPAISKTWYIFSWIQADTCVAVSVAARSNAMFMIGTRQECISLIS